LAEFRTAVAIHGIPASTLTDYGMVFTMNRPGSVWNYSDVLRHHMVGLTGFEPATT
jgi:hypothetical protein